MVLVCCPGPIRRRSGRTLVTKTPNKAMLDGPAIMIPIGVWLGSVFLSRTGRTVGR